MIDDKRVLAIIPARGGSKGLPGKNIRDLCGKPVIAWSIEKAKKSCYVDVVLVTTDRDRKSTRLNSSHIQKSRMPSSA